MKRQGKGSIGDAELLSQYDSVTPHQRIQNQRIKRMRLRKLVNYGIFALVLVIGFCFTAIARGYEIPPPTQQIAIAQQTSDLMLNTLFAALTQEFDETTAIT